MGGGLRQVGILAAAGIISLTDMVTRLEEDHQNARYLASRLEEIDACSVIRNRLDINMVFFTLPESVITEANLVTGLLKKNIKISGSEDGEYRFVTNQGVSSDDIDWVIESMKTLVSHYS